MKISSVKLHVASMASNWLTEKVIANPMSIYPEYQERRSSWYRTHTGGVVEIEVEDGTVGYGFVGSAKAAASKVVLEEQVRDLVVGRDCFATELISEQLTAATSYFGRGGISMALLSGIDIALWDLKGKLLDRPVYELLGGPAVPALRPYLTSWDADALEEFGIRDVKIAVPFGPAAGEEGKRANEAAVASAREAIGDDGFIALDCYMAWDVPYTVEMARRLAEYRIEWIEEPVAPDNFDGYRRIRESIETKISGGEHLFTLRAFHDLMERGLVDIVQPDIYRAGGPTALKKIAALAEANDIRLMCHGVGLATFHFMLSCHPRLSPRCEYLDIHAGAASPWFFANEPRPRDGLLAISDKPGFGYELEPAALKGEQVAPVW